MNETWLVTGGAGFIGSNIVDRYLADGHEVAIIDDLSTGRRSNLNPDASFHELSITDAEAVLAVFEQEMPEVVSHHAAQMDVRRSVAEPQFDAETNIIGTLSVLEAGRRVEARKFIFSSSGGAIYGQADVIPTPESAPLQPISHYGASKLAGEVYFGLYGRLYGIETTVLRYANVYGPRQDPHGEAGVVAIFSQLMLAGKQPKIFGDGTSTRDYVYVSDIVEANMIALERGDGARVNLGWGEEIPVQRVFDCVRDSVGCDIEPNYVPERLGEVARISLDASRAKEILGWEPQVALEDGIARSVDFYRRLAAGEITR